jgi:hypothetical protein
VLCLALQVRKKHKGDRGKEEETRKEDDEKKE